MIIKAYNVLRDKMNIKFIVPIKSLNKEPKYFT